MLNKVSFDWFSFTIKGKDVVRVMSDLGLKRNEFEMAEYSRFGYASMLKHESFDIYVLFDGSDAMGVHVDVSGGAIKYFMTCFSAVCCATTPFGAGCPANGAYNGVFGLLAEYVLLNGKFSRVDVNIDTDIPFMNPYNLHSLMVAGRFVSYYRSWKFLDNDKKAGTLYIGKRQSFSFIRIYDKAKEQGDFESTLYRFEVQFNKGADNFMMNFLELGLAGALSAFVSKQLRFIEDNNYLSDMLQGWSDFLALIRDSDALEYVNYVAKKNKTSVYSLVYMFEQYGNIISDFLGQYATHEDFLELMQVVCSRTDKASYDTIIDLCLEKGWDYSCKIG